MHVLYKILNTCFRAYVNEFNEKLNHVAMSCHNCPAGFKAIGLKNNLPFLFNNEYGCAKKHLHGTRYITEVR